MASASAEDERTSTSSQASVGIAFTLMPPPTRETESVVRGACGSGSVASFAIVAPAACTGFGVPNADQLCPPHP